jgi:hypothetical protein
VRVRACVCVCVCVCWQASTYGRSRHSLPIDVQVGSITKTRSRIGFYKLIANAAPPYLSSACMTLSKVYELVLYNLAA